MCCLVKMLSAMHVLYKLNIFSIRCHYCSSFYMRDTCSWTKFDTFWVSLIVVSLLIITKEVITYEFVSWEKFLLALFSIRILYVSSIKLEVKCITFIFWSTVVIINSYCNSVTPFISLCSFENTVPIVELISTAVNLDFRYITFIYSLQ